LKGKLKGMRKERGFWKRETATMVDGKNCNAEIMSW